MSEKVFEVILQQKNGTEEKWNDSSYVPRKSEIIHYTDLNKIKIGDGVTLAKNLPFIGGGGNSESDSSIQSDWLQTTDTATDYIKNKPDIKKGSVAYSIVEGYESEATKAGAHAEGYQTHAKGEGSHSEGYNTYATATGTHAEGSDTQATNTGAHAEGYKTIASGYCSHAEGKSTTAEGDDSHAEGVNTTAFGHYSHVEGNGTRARGRTQHVEGRYNVLDPGVKEKTDDGTFAHIVGNGTSGQRSNAYALEWNGTGRFAGDVYVQSEKDSTGGKKLATEEYVDNLASSLEEKYSDYIISENSTTTYQSDNTIVWNWYCRKWNNGKIEIWVTAKTTITSDQWEKKSVAYPFYQVKGHLHSSIPQELFPSQSIQTKIQEQATISFTGGYWMPLSLMCRENLNNDPNLSTTTGANTNMYNLSTSFQSTPTSEDNIDICLNIYIVGTYQNETPQA